MPPTPLSVIAVLFLRLGTTAFGGPVAHVAMMEEEVVRRRQWLTRDQFLDYLGATNLIPGPNSTELAIHIGHARAGWPGLLVAGTCFILPAMLIVWAIAWLYVRYGSLPDAAALLYGIKPVVIAVVFQALFGLGHTAIKSAALGGLAIASIVAVAAGAHELVVLAAAGVIMGLFRVGATPPRSSASALFAINSFESAQKTMTPALAVTASAAIAAPVGLWPLFLVFAKIGSVLFGSGYVLLAFLRADFVQRLGWLTEQQLLDAVAIGQVTPGPVFTTATFIGYILAGSPGAVVATIGIFLPAFFFVAISGPLVPRLRASAIASGVLDGVNVASLALMTVVSWQLARTALVDAVTIAIAVVSAIAIIRYRINSAWLVACGGALGWIVMR